uniref:Uncharacterized protein n=1 Tax=Kalanchoe fedtschenkoi TaxID=63787 RepID=A0A7N0TYH0_KALFE
MKIRTERLMRKFRGPPECGEGCRCYEFDALSSLSRNTSAADCVSCNKIWLAFHKVVDLLSPWRPLRSIMFEEGSIKKAVKSQEKQIWFSPKAKNAILRNRRKFPPEDQRPTDITEGKFRQAF